MKSENEGIAKIWLNAFSCVNPSEEFALMWDDEQ